LVFGVACYTAVEILSEAVLLNSLDEAEIDRQKTILLKELEACVDFVLDSVINMLFFTTISST